MIEYPKKILLATDGSEDSIRAEMLQNEREVFVRMRDEGRLDDEILRRLQGNLDLEEVLLREEQPPETNPPDDNGSG